jgi:hypothetical protein
MGSTPQIIFSMCNQSRQGLRRIQCLAGLDVDTGAITWVRAGTTRRDFGVTGLAEDGHGFYAAVQAHDNAIRIIHYNRRSFRIVSEFPLQLSGDPHSLCIHQGELLLASTANNAIYHLVRKNGKIVNEELFWRYPGTSDGRNDVHLNCMASYQDELYVTAFGPRNDEGKFDRSGVLRNIGTNAVCVSNMHQPHTILFHRDRLYCASSATGELVISTQVNGEWVEKRIALRGYPRGIAPWGDGVLVGISAHRTHSRSQGTEADLAPGHYTGSQIILLNADGEEDRVIVDTTAFGNEVYEIISIIAEDDQAFPAPLKTLHLESLKTSVQRSFWR